MRSLIFLIALFDTVLVSAQTASEVEITTKNDSKYEVGVAERMQNLLDEYDLSKWIFTRKVIVEDNVIPHSHPVLTLNTKNQGNNELLSTFIHEQIHWYLSDDANKGRVSNAMDEFKRKYKDVPVGGRKGARDEYSTYLHLIVCYLEYAGIAELISQEVAEKVTSGMNHYTWIYEKVLYDRAYIADVVTRNKLNLKN